MGKVSLAAMLAVFLVARTAGSAQQAAVTPVQAGEPGRAAQEPDSSQEAATIRVTTRSVEIAAVVRNKAGEPQTGMTRDDFVLKVDGKEQPIAHFAVAADQPLTLALVVDVSGSQRTFLSDEWRASDVFFQSMLTGAKDRAMLVQVDARVLQLMGMTHSAERLHLALTQLGQSPSASMATLLFEAVYSVAKDRLAAEKGRKALVLLTDGGDNGSRIPIEKAIEQAQRANVPVYAIDYSAWTGPELYPGGGFHRLGESDPGVPILKKLAETTGGRVYTVGSGSTLQRIYEQIGSDLRTEYDVAYVPPASLAPNSFHKLELRARDKKLSVQARSGFYMQP